MTTNIGNVFYKKDITVSKINPNPSSDPSSVHVCFKTALDYLCVSNLW